MRKVIIATVFLIMAVRLIFFPSNSPNTGTPESLAATRPPLFEYRDTFLAVRRALKFAQFAAMCGLRSDAYFQAVTVSARNYLQSEAKRLHMSSSDVADADHYAQRTLQLEAENRPEPRFDKICEELATSPKLAAIDSLLSQ